jgi:hypothetical protein
MRRGRCGWVGCAEGMPFAALGHCVRLAGGVRCRSGQFGVVRWCSGSFWAVRVVRNRSGLIGAVRGCSGPFAVVQDGSGHQDHMLCSKILILAGSKSSDRGKFANRILYINI